MSGRPGGGAFRTRRREERRPAQARTPQSSRRPTRDVRIRRDSSRSVSRAEVLPSTRRFVVAPYPRAARGRPSARTRRPPARAPSPTFEPSWHGPRNGPSRLGRGEPVDDRFLYQLCKVLVGAKPLVEAAVELGWNRVVAINKLFDAMGHASVEFGLFRHHLPDPQRSGSPFASQVTRIAHVKSCRQSWWIPRLVT